MRRWLLVLAVLAVGCSDDGEPKLAADQPAATTTSPPEDAEDFEVGDRVETSRGNFMTVYSYEQGIPSPAYTEPEAGQVWAVVDYEFCAGPDFDETGIGQAGPGDVELVMPDNTRRTFDVAVREPSMSYADLAREGDCNRGWITFQVPEGVKPVYIAALYTGPPVRWIIP